MASTDSEGQWSWGQNLVDLLFSLPLTPGCDVPEQFSVKMICLRISDTGDNFNEDLFKRKFQIPTGNGRMKGFTCV